ncbi:phage tail protein, partial [Escherichia coli]|nr:phage tail protein [Escherichia coli]MCQ5670600.1 phage tail protein [Escherichia coli]MCQ5680348.1 phage tail protein [Escherichia coli]MCQ5699752.1 phage tail protein [Escherichia coli]MCQ5714234.1 phage tail protein [Escherichia coli]
SVIKEVILTLVLGLTHAQNVVLEVDPDRAIITQEIGDRRYLQRKKNLSDVEDKDEAVENLGLKPTVDKAKNAVQRDGDTMTGELKIRGVNALRIFNEAFCLIFRRSEECLHLIPTQENQGENGDIGPLRPFTMNLRTGEITMSKVSVGGDSQVRGALGIGVQNALGGNSIAIGDSDTGFKQNGDGLLDVYANGQHVFRFQNGALQSNRSVNVSGRVTPSDYGNFDARYQTKTGGVQDVRLGGAIGIGRGGNAPSGHLLSGVDGGESVGWANARPVQVLINGVWRNVASL